MASSAAGRYPYRALSQKPDEPEIRLLSLTYPPPTHPTSPPQQPESSTNDDNTCLLSLTHHHLPLTGLTPPDIDTTADMEAAEPTNSNPARPIFAALSYVWGLPPNPADNPPQIQIDGHTVPITTNLHAALARLQRQRFAGYLWVDALCINQADTIEKNAQVALMGRIYALAETVAVWLGPAETCSDLEGLRAVGELGALFRELVLDVPGGLSGPGAGGRLEGFVRTLERLAITAGGNTGSGVVTMEGEGSASGGNGGSSASSGGNGDGAETQPEQQRVGFDFEAIWRLFQERPWWRRVWIIQEVVLARQAVMLCGDNPELPGASVSWQDVRDCLRLFERMVMYPNTLPKHRRLYKLLGNIYFNVSHLPLASDQYRRDMEKWKRQGNSAGPELSQAVRKPYTGLTLLEMLISTSCGTGIDNSILATDSRDRIYGLLGMVREEDRRRIPIDYSPNMTLGKVLFAVGKALLEDCGPEILCLCQDSWLSPAGLPSWVPDWTAPRLISNIGGVFVGSDKEARVRGDASKGASWQEWAAKCQTKDAVYENPVISLHGIVVGRVDSLGREFTSVPDSPSHLDDCRDWLVEIEEMTKARNAPESPVLDEIWRVPVADLGVSGIRASDEGAARYIHGFDVLMGRTSPPSPETGSGAATSWVFAESEDYRRAWENRRRRAFVDDVGRPGLVLKDAAVGDQVVVFAGAHLPFIVRPELRTGTRQRCRVIGTAYVYGLMDGEALADTVSFGLMDIL
ncbi:HET-domain-containing protein [Parathielavia hyrcaniae]|uniref:HET-domain-containing protein n=1 Tax=Parathielavia hyrcaniae TaxID=113614 RepID=A0AAN6PQ22_9PEZI|nr:HET-domain-containing protein [Parathielavia hyrcaniae]